ncbi:MAG TPA: right-handed parallel beta-helix repeat-containing protein [Candidatus Dependentiae bacterium]|nr:right-handed parallel beta-helix repeat-containing protein [Candidatus Dependentiae bacterium]HRQ62265.1 right-handed parallel beta-helix repeat-containing protein [Candidatus Dependentiae bacterium]
MKDQPSRKYIIVLLSMYACSLYSLIDPQPGENIHNLLFRTAQEVDATFTTVVEIQSTVDMNQSLLELISSQVDGIDTDLSIHDVMICSKLEVIESKIDEIVVESDGSQLDIIESKVCIIESLVEALDIMVSGSLGTMEVLSAVEALSVEVSVDNILICSKLDVIDSKIDEIMAESNASQLDVLESKIDVIDTELSIDSMLICSKLEHIENELALLSASEIDLINKNMMILVSISDDLLDTFTVLSSVSEIILDNLSDLDVLVSGLSSQIDKLDTDLSIDNELINSKLMVIDSKIDEIIEASDASQLDVLESKIDVLTTDVSVDNELICSKLEVIDSKIDEIGTIDVSQLDVLESNIDVLTSDVSVDNELICSKLMVIDSKIDEIGAIDVSQLDAIESKVDVLIVDVSLDNELICSKLIVIDSKIDEIESSDASQLDVIESKVDVLDVDVSVHDALVRSQLDVIESIVEDLNIDTELIISQLDVLESKVDVIDTDLSLDNEMICSKLMVIDSKIDEILAISEESLLDVLESKIDVLDVEISIHDELVRSQLDVIESIVEDLNIDTNFIISQLDVLESKVDVIDIEISVNDALILDELAVIESRLDDLAECCACDVIIMQADIPYSIEAPGVYCLGEDIDASAFNVGIGIVSTENVLLDLRGHTINGGGTTNNAIQVISSDNVVIQNGRIVGTDVDAITVSSSTSERVIIRDMQISDVIADGISVSGTNCTVTRCEITSFTGVGINITPSANVRAVIEDCIIRNGVTGILTSSIAANCSIINCECSGNTTAGFNIQGANNVVANCVASGNTGGSGIGFDISGANCQVKDSSSVGNTVGIDLNGVTTIELCNNIVNGNTTDFAGGAYDSDLCNNVSVFDVTICSKLMVIESKIDNMMSGNGDTSLLEVIESKIDLLACPHMITQADIPLTIAAAGTYCLTEDVVGSGTSILVNVSNVTVDLHGYMLDANGGVGIGLNTNITDIEIRNGTIVNPTIGIGLNNATNIVVSDIQMFDATSYSLTSSGASQLQLTDMSVFDVATGFYFDGSTDMQLVNCCVMNATQHGFRFYNTTRATVYASAAINAGNSAPYYGFWCDLCTDMVFINCTAQDCGNAGFIVQATTSAVFRNCVAQRNGAATTASGFLASVNSLGIVWSNCRSSFNSQHGFATTNIESVLIRDCIATDNSSNGFDTSAVDLMVLGCQAVNNTTNGFRNTVAASRFWNNATMGNGTAYSGVTVAHTLAGSSVRPATGHYWINISD